MAPFHNNKLNTISLYDSEDSEYSPDMPANMLEMSAPITTSHNKFNTRTTSNSTPDSNIKDEDNAECVAIGSEHLALDDVQHGGWDSGSWNHNTPYPDIDFGQGADTGASHDFEDSMGSPNSRFCHRALTYEVLNTPDTGIFENDGTMPVIDHVNSFVNNCHARDESQGSQQSSGGGKDVNNFKSEDKDGNHSVSLTPSRSGEYDESDESDFGGSRALNIPKTNKDGGVRKPRQPRSKLLKWNDNDWKNVVLGIIWACGETGVQIPFDQAAQIVGESCTAGALQQAVLKLRQKQVAEGNFVPSLRMAWARKLRNTGSSTSDANDEKITQVTPKAKNTLPKRKPTRFSGNQSLIVTIKRAYKDADRAFLGYPHRILSELSPSYQSHGSVVPFEDDATMEPMDSSGGYQDPATPIASVQHRRGQLQVSKEGSPFLGSESRARLSLETQQVKTSNRKSRVYDGVLYQRFALPGGDINEIPTDMSTPALTIDSGFRTQLGTPTSNVTPGRGHVMAYTGPMNWLDHVCPTPPNTTMARNAIARGLNSNAHNPQGTQQYEFTAYDNMPFFHDGGPYNISTPPVPDLASTGLDGTYANGMFASNLDDDDPFMD